MAGEAPDWNELIQRIEKLWEIEANKSVDSTLEDYWTTEDVEYGGEAALMEAADELDTAPEQSKVFKLGQSMSQGFIQDVASRTDENIQTPENRLSHTEFITYGIGAVVGEGLFLEGFRYFNSETSLASELFAGAVGIAAGLYAAGKAQKAVGESIVNHCVDVDSAEYELIENPRDSHAWNTVLSGDKFAVKNFDPYSGTELEEFLEDGRVKEPDRYGAKTADGTILTDRSSLLEYIDEVLEEAYSAEVQVERNRPFQTIGVAGHHEDPVETDLEDHQNEYSISIIGFDSQTSQYMARDTGRSDVDYESAIDELELGKVIN